jgi:citronellol/citronellal dehydrogenase
VETSSSEAVTLAGQSVLITGASRGIGRAIALRLAQDGARLALVARDGSLLQEVVAEVESAGGQALALVEDLCRPAEAAETAQRCAAHYGGIDAIVHNAAQIALTPFEQTPLELAESLLDVNLRAPLHLTRAALPWLRKSANPHVLAMSPPLNLNKRWFAAHLPYTLSKYALSMAVLGLAEEFRRYGIAVNALWPRTVIHTDSLRNASHIQAGNTRYPQIVADAVHEVLSRPARRCSGNFFLDEEVLREAGVTDFRHYAVEPGQPLASDLFTD